MLLPSLPVSNDELTLTTADGDQAVHSFDASLHRLPNRDTGDDAGGLQTHASADAAAKGALRGRKRSQLEQLVVRSCK